MSTNNPKVSAYIPQHIYDSFKSFYEQRNISMSQAVAVIFAEYFELDLSVDRKSSTSGLLVERVGLLEQELAVLRELVQKHLQSGGAVQEKEHLVVCDIGSPEAVSLDVAEPTSIIPSEPPKEGGLSEAESLEVLENVEASSIEGDLFENTPSELVSGLQGELFGDSDLTRTEAVEVKSPEVLKNVETPLADGDASEIVSGELASNLLNEQLDNNEFSEKVKPETAKVQQSLSYLEVPLFSIPGSSLKEIKPISGKKLSKRLRLSPDAVSGRKTKLKDVQSFTNWTRPRDPDKIGWIPVETPVPGYVPADELSSELRDKLLIWMRENNLF
jgi:hypothetical protein